MGLKHWAGRNEKTVVFIIGIILAIPLVLLISLHNNFSGDRYDSLVIDYTQVENGLLVKETFDIHSASTNQVLYRSFRDDIVFDSSEVISQVFPEDIFIQSVDCSIGDPYVYTKDSLGPANGVTGVPLQTSIPSTKFKLNEVGCYRASNFRGSNELLTVTYFIPQITLDKYNNKHTIFSEWHFPIRTLTVNTPAGSNSYDNLKQKSIIGVQLSDGEILVEKNPSTTSFWILALLIIFIPYLLWIKFGSEKNFVVPKYLHTIPDKNMPAWQVDLLVNGSGKLSKNGIASIMLELNVLKVITFSERKKFFSKISIFTIKKDYKTILARRPKLIECVDLIMMKKVSETSTSYVCEIPSGDRLFSVSMQSFTKASNIKKMFFDSKGDNLFTAYFIIYFIILYYAILTLLGGLLFNPIFILIVLIVLRYALVPKSIFSRFKEDYYKSYLEWLSFKAMLDDYAQIKRYLKEDYNQWKSWLVYGTALGSADKVLNNLKELSIITNAEYDSYHSYHTSMLLFAAASMPSSRGGGGGFGGAGGGFGGGGGGGR